MICTGQNAYERAFEGRLREQGVRFARVDQSRRGRPADATLKTFDYLLYPRQGDCVLVELKGRLFTGASLEGRRGLQRWVFNEDVTSLQQWQRAFARRCLTVRTAFVFAYRLSRIAVDEDGLELYRDGGGRYVFLAIWRRDYQRWMTGRSRQWKTVTCPAEAFRKLSFPAEQLWLGDMCDVQQYAANADRAGACRSASVPCASR